ncbi:chemotaxis protein CheB [Hymenobacter sp. ISL-91]|nr:chemotaxis protein CheB [Hymenobacter sp. ISL-91]
MGALTRLVSQLPASLPAAVLIVQHLAPTSSGPHLVGRLQKATRLVCALATDGQALEAGHLYLAPPDRHLLVQSGQMLVTKGPRENNFRPAVDALFRSAAAYHGAAVVGVVLTGLLHDGTAGLDQIKRAGGRAVVQDPLEAEFSSMPESALNNVAVDYVAPLAEMGALLTRLVHETPPPAAGSVPEDIRLEAAIAERVVGNTEEVAQLGRPVPFTCPGCGGSLWQLNEGNVVRFRCHTGHAFTLGTLLDDSRQGLEETLWVALRMMEERKNLLRTLAAQPGTSAGTSNSQFERIAELKNHVNRLREFLLNGLDRPLSSLEPEK